MERVTDASIIALFEAAKKNSGLSNLEIAEAAGIPAADGDQAIRNALRRQRMIHVPLVDWILKQTVFAGNPVERAMTHLHEAGLTPEQLDHIRKGIEIYQPKLESSAKHAFVGVGERESQPQKSQTPPLRLEETEALVKWFGTNLETMPLERPLTKALRKIAMMLDDGTVPAELPEDSGTTAATSESASTTAPTEAAQPQPHQHRPSTPLKQVSSSPSSPSKAKPGKKI